MSPVIQGGLGVVFTGLSFKSMWLGSSRCIVRQNRVATQTRRF